jgi:hypothetical protein
MLGCLDLDELLQLMHYYTMLDEYTVVCLELDEYTM